MSSLFQAMLEVAGDYWVNNPTLSFLRVHQALVEAFDQQGYATISAVCTRTDLPRSTVLRVVDELVDLNFVAGEDDPDDGRVNRYVPVDGQFTEIRRQFNDRLLHAVVDHFLANVETYRDEVASRGVYAPLSGITADALLEELRDPLKRYLEQQARARADARGTRR